MTQRWLYIFFFLTMALLVLAFFICYITPGFTTIFSYLTTLFTFMAGISTISFGLFKLSEAHRYKY